MATSKEHQSATNQLTLGKFSTKSTTDQLARAIANLGIANDDATKAAGVQSHRARLQSADDRFGQLLKLQGSARGIMSNAGNALQGSQAAGVGQILGRRNGLDNAEVWGTLRGNLGAIQDSLTETINANANAGRDAYNNAAFAVRGIENNTAAALNNIAPSLFKKPGTGSTNFGSSKVAKKVPSAKAIASGYMLP